MTRWGIVTEEAKRSALSAAHSASLSASLSAADSASLSAARSAARSAALSAADSAALFAARSAALSAADSAALFAARSAALSAADSAALFAARSAALSAAWALVEREVEALAGPEGISALVALPLWPDGQPDWSAENWQTLKTHLLAAEDEDWGFWIDWYEAQLAGVNPASVNLALEEAILLIDDEIWEAGPKVANAEIRRLMQVHAPKSKRRPRMTIEEALALAERDDRGFTVVQQDGVFTLDHSAIADREQVEADLPMMRKRAARMLRAFEHANYPLQQDCAEDIRDFIAIIEGNYDAIAREARNLWNISIGFGSAFERDTEERKREGELLTGDQRAAVDIFLATSANFVRLFPAVRAMDSENRLHRNIDNRHTLTVALIKSSVKHDILLKADADILLALAQIANAATSQSAKAANALDATKTNLLKRVALLGAAGVGAVATGALAQVGVDLETQLELSERSIEFIRAAENDIRAFIGSLPSDVRAPMAHAIDAILARDDP